MFILLKTIEVKFSSDHKMIQDYNADLHSIGNGSYIRSYACFRIFITLCFEVISRIQRA